MTRFYVQLIIRSVKGVISFLLIFVYSTIAFGVIFYKSGNYNETTGWFNYMWQVPFDLSMGNFQSNTSEPYQYICFLITSFLNVIIILNLLISILGDEFEQFQIDAAEIDKREMLDGIIEIERLMFWNRGKSIFKHLQLCNEVSTDEDDGEWEGKVKAFQQQIKKLETATKIEIKNLTDHIDLKFNHIQSENLKILGKLDEIKKSDPKSLVQSKSLDQ